MRSRVRLFLTPCILFIAYCALLIAHWSVAGCNSSPETYATDSDTAQLPFPEFQVIRTDTSLDNGFFLMAPFRMAITANRATSTLIILSGKGHVVYCKPGVTASDFKSHPNGVLSYYNSRCFVLLDSNLMITDSVACVDGATTDSHDFQILPNGNYVLIGMRTEVRDFSSFEIQSPKRWKGGKSTTANYGIIQELSPDKKLVYEWSSQGEYEISDFDPVYLNDTTKLDLPHFNSVDVDAKGNYLISARYTNEVIYVNKNSGRIEWRLGGNRSSFKVTGEQYPFYGQHDARFRPNGNILLFDNGYSYPGNTHPARSVEYQLDENTMAATCVWSWSWQTSLVSEATGNTQRFASGFSLLNFGKIQSMSENILCAVADEEKNVIFQIAFTDTMGSYSTHYYETLPVNLSQPEIRLTQSTGSIQLTVANGESCIWNNGVVGSSITVTSPGTYQTFLPRDDGSYMGSHPIQITDDLLNPTNTP